MKGDFVTAVIIGVVTVALAPLIARVLPAPAATAQ